MYTSAQAASAELPASLPESNPTSHHQSLQSKWTTLPPASHGFPPGVLVILCYLPSVLALFVQHGWRSENLSLTTTRLHTLSCHNNGFSSVPAVPAAPPPSASQGHNLALLGLHSNAAEEEEEEQKEEEEEEEELEEGRRRRSRHISIMEGMSELKTLTVYELQHRRPTEIPRT